MTKLTDFRVAVLPTDGFEETELTEPVKALKDAGAPVTILSLKPGQIQGVRHDLDQTVRLKIDRPIRDVSAEDFDAVHLPGGTVNADTLRIVPEVQARLRAQGNNPVPEIDGPPAPDRLPGLLFRVSGRHRPRAWTPHPARSACRCHRDGRRDCHRPRAERLLSELGAHAGQKSRFRGKPRFPRDGGRLSHRRRRGIRDRFLASLVEAGLSWPYWATLEDAVAQPVTRSTISGVAVIAVDDGGGVGVLYEPGPEDRSRPPREQHRRSHGRRSRARTVQERAVALWRRWTRTSGGKSPRASASPPAHLLRSTLTRSARPRGAGVAHA